MRPFLAIVLAASSSAYAAPVTFIVDATVATVVSRGGHSDPAQSGQSDRSSSAFAPPGSGTTAPRARWSGGRA